MLMSKVFNLQWLVKRKRQKRFEGAEKQLEAAVQLIGNDPESSGDSNALEGLLECSSRISQCLQVATGLVHSFLFLFFNFNGEICVFEICMHYAILLYTIVLI